LQTVLEQLLQFVFFGKESMRLAIILAVLLIVAVFPWALAVYGATILAYYLWYVISGLFATGFLIFAYWYSHKTSERINRRRARQAKQENN
jgi:Zn-dependent protease with chaperone function